MPTAKTKAPSARKSLGQHYLKDASVIQKITKDFAADSSAIIEVGPGPGVLTEHLALLKKPFKAVEMDQRFLPHLGELMPGENIVLADATTVDFSQMFPTVEKNIWLVSNLPYNVSVPLFLKFLQTPSIGMMTLMFQKEVGEKILPPEKLMSKSMNSLLLLGQNYFECKKLCRVLPGSFNPPPKVDSIVLSFKRSENPAIPLTEFQQLESFIRKLFAFKRKQILKILKAHYPEERILKAFTRAQVAPTDRAETFNLEQVRILYQCLCTH